MSTLSRTLPRQVGTLLYRVWQVVTDGVRLFVWETLRTGMIDLRPLGGVLRLLTVTGLVLVFGFLASILFSDVLRTLSALEPLDFESSSTRGLLAPALAVPLTLGALLFAWSFILTGALAVRSARARWFVFLLYLLFELSGLLSGVFGVPAHAGFLSLGLMGLAYVGVFALLVLAFIFLPRLSLPLYIQFIFILGLNTTLVALGLAQAAAAQVRTGFPYPAGYLIGTTVSLARVLIIPLLFLSGVEWVNFGVEVARWTTVSVRRHATGWIMGALLGLFLSYRLYGLAVNTIAKGLNAEQLQAWAGAVLLCLGLVAIMLWLRRRARGESVPYGLVVLLVVGLPLFQIVSAPLLTLIGLFFVLNAYFFEMLGWTNLTALLAEANRALGFVGELSNSYRDYRQLIAVALSALVVVAAARRRNLAVAAFGLVLGWSQLLEWLTAPSRWLESFSFQYADVDVIWLIALTSLTLFWTIRRELTTERTLALFALAILGAVLTQTSFLDNPFSPLFSFAGVFFLVFGILWNVLTVGGRFTNTDSPRFPRASRLLLYVGYVLLSVTIAHWFIVSHNIEMQRLQSDLTMDGFRIFGLALAYLAFVQGGASLVPRDEA